MKRIIQLKGNSEVGYSVSIDFEKDVTSKSNESASAQNIELLLEQQKRTARRLFDKEFPEAITL